MFERALDLPVGGALGHSFGGKVVLQWLGSRNGIATEAWVIDASPSPIELERERSATEEIIGKLEALPRTWESRDAFVHAVVDAGEPEPFARWLAMNLRPTADGGRAFGPDLAVIRALLEDYARTDLWHVVGALPARCSLGFVVGGRSLAFSAADRRRAAMIQQQDPRVFVQVIPDAGHWVHMDSPDALLALLTSPPSLRR